RLRRIVVAKGAIGEGDHRHQRKPNGGAAPVLVTIRRLLVKGHLRNMPIGTLPNRRRGVSILSTQVRSWRDFFKSTRARERSPCSLTYSTKLQGTHEESSAKYSHTKPNQLMKPTRSTALHFAQGRLTISLAFFWNPLRYKFSVFATNIARGLSLSR